MAELIVILSVFWIVALLVVWAWRPDLRAWIEAPKAIEETAGPDHADAAFDRARPAKLGLVLLTCGAIGLCIIFGVLALDRSRAAAADRAAPMEATEEYGRRLIAQTPSLIGPDQADPTMRLAGSRIACGSCHLDAGTRPGALSLLQAASRYPKFSGRDGGVRDLQDRINGCMTRSLNGRALARDSTVMLAMVAYIRSLGDLYAAMDARARSAAEPKAFVAPARAADLDAGKTTFIARCARCHGENGAGLRATRDPIDGYAIPPLWGDDSFNDGAGMNRVLTAAPFIKARMPLGEATLTDDEAFDVAAYVDAQPRPRMAGLEKDYPDLTTKPIDSGYGPYADAFPIEQHRFGPFPPIAAHYRAQAKDSKDAKDTKDMKDKPAQATH